MPLDGFESLFYLAKQKGRRRFVVVGAASEAVLVAVSKAWHGGLIDLILPGPSDIIQRMAHTMRVDLSRHNAIDAIRRLGVSRPELALLAANEKISEKLPKTMDAAEIVRLLPTGRFPDAMIEGPLPLEMAFDPEAARIKGRPNPVSGDPDILPVPDISSGNILSKGLVYLAGAQIARTIIGTKIPIVLISRAESLHRSITLAIALS